MQYPNIKVEKKLLMMGNRKTMGYFSMVAALLFGGFIFLYHCSLTSFSSQLLLSRKERINHQQSITIRSNPCTYSMNLSIILKIIT